MQGDFFFSVIRCISTSFFCDIFAVFGGYAHMTHKITRFLTLFLLVSLGGCTVQSEHHVPENAAFCDDLTKHVQQVQQLHVASGTTPCPTKTPDTAAVCNYQTTYGMWFPYLDYADTLAGKTAEQFRESMHQRFQQAADMGINTVYLHLRAFGDAYYCSQLFPPSGSSGRFRPASHSAGGGTPAAPVCPRLDQSPAAAK